MTKNNATPTQHMIAGAVSGGVSRFIIAPLDVIKIRFQVQRAADREYYSVYQAYRSIVAQEGVRALWKGTFSAQLMVVPYVGASFGAYEKTKIALHDHNPNYSKSFVSLVSGSVAGLAATVTTYPLDLTRTRMAAQREPKIYPTLRHAFAYIYRESGITGYYRGVVPACVGIIPYAAFQFLFYESSKSFVSWIKQTFHQPLHTTTESHEKLLNTTTTTTTTTQPLLPKPSSVVLTVQDIKAKLMANAFSKTLINTNGNASLSQQTLQPWELFCCGFIAGIFAKLLSHPFDVFKKQMQVAGFNYHRSEPVMSTTPPQTFPHPLLPKHSLPLHYDSHRVKVWQVAKHLFYEEGIRGLFKGVVPSMLKAGPNSAIVFMTYEMTLKFLCER